MKIFITGATGYIGYAVASALAAKGHEVFGLVRSEAGAKKVAAAEIEPLMGTMNEPDSYLATAASCSLSIHCAADMSENFHLLDRKTVEALIKAATQSGLPRRIIYTSGVWIYGNTGNTRVNETAPRNPPTLVKPREETEKKLLHANQGNLATVCIRPGCVYGGTGGLSASWFSSALQGNSASIVGDGHFRWSTVHVQDLADLYVRVAESNYAGEIFNATDTSRFTVLECAEAVNHVTGKDHSVKCIPVNEAIKTMGPFAECLALDQHIDSSKAYRWLNWQPRHTGFVDGVARYFTSWKSDQVD